MKKAISIIASVILAFGLFACATEPVQSEAANEDSVASSVEPAQLEPAAVEPESSEPVEEPPQEPIFDNGFDGSAYDPVDLCRDNPLVETEIESVKLCLYGVGETRLAVDYADVIGGIVKNDARVWQDPNTEAGKTYGIYEHRSPGFVVTLASGEELEAHAHKASGNLTNVLSINDEDYALSSEDYDTFKAVYEAACDWLISASDTYVMPYADLTKDDLAKIERIGTYYATEGNEQYLTESQVDLVVEALNNLYVVPSTADFNPDGLAGGSYEYFKLLFRDGKSVMIGAYDLYSVYDEEFNMIDQYPVAYFDGVLYRCNEDYAEDMYWNHEESAEGYRRQYLHARTMPDYPFEDLTVDEVELIFVELDNDSYGWTTGLASRAMADEVVDTLRQLRRTEDNSVFGGTSSLAGLDGMSRKTLTILLTNGERVFLDTDGTDSYISYGRYAQDSDVIAAIETLIADARESHARLIESTGEWTLVEAEGAGLPDQMDDIFGVFMPFSPSFSFDLPSVLTEHDDGYYPDGYTLDDAPVSVTLMTYTTQNGNKDPDSSQARLEEEMAASGGDGYTKYSVQMDRETGTLIVHWGQGGEDTELLYVSGMLSAMEIDIKGSDDYELTPEAVLALLLGSIGQGSPNQEIYDNTWGSEFR